MIGSADNWTLGPMPTQYSRLISDLRLLIFPAHQKIEASLNRTSTVSTGVLVLGVKSRTITEILEDQITPTP